MEVKTIFLPSGEMVPSALSEILKHIGVLHEHVTKVQLAGLGLAGAAVVLITI